MAPSRTEQKPGRLRPTLSRPCLPNLDPATRTLHPYGDTPPEYLFRGVQPSDEVAAVLCLGCGDLRSVLYSLWRETAHCPAQSTAAAVPRFEVTLNDINPRVQARNLLLLDLLLSQGVELSTVWGIWFSLFLSKRQASILQQAVERLATLGRSPAAVSAYFRDVHSVRVWFGAASDYHAVYGVLVRWGAMSRPLKTATVQNLRRGRLSQALSPSTLGFANLSGLGVDYLDREKLSAKQGASEEMARYWETGVCQAQTASAAKMAFDTVNISLQDNDRQYTLFPFSCPFHAFPPVLATDESPAPLLKSAIHQLKLWRASLLAHKATLSLDFSTADALQLCHDLRASGRVFQNISAGDVGDGPGLLPLLLATRGLVPFTDGPSCGSMSTHISRFRPRYATEAEYLADNLHLHPSFWPSCFGWRCVGHEGAGQLEYQFNRLQSPTVMKPASKPLAQQLCTAQFLWLPAPPAPPYLTTRLRKSPGAAGGDLMAGVEGLMKHYARAGLHCSHLSSLVPLFLSIRPTDAPKAGATEAGDLLALLSGDLGPSDFVLSTAQVPHAKSGKAASGEGAPLVSVALIQAGVEPVAVTSTWIGPGATKDSDAVHWLCRRARLREADAVRVIVRTGTTVVEHRLESFDLTFRGLEAEDVAGLRRGLLPAPADPEPTPVAAVAAVAENKQDFKVDVPLEGTAWKEALQAGSVLVAVADGPYALVVGGKPAKWKHGLALPQRFAFPCAVSPKGSELRLSRKRWTLTLVVRKGPYPFVSSLAAQLWPLDTVSLAPPGAPEAEVQSIQYLSGAKERAEEARRASGMAVPKATTVVPPEAKIVTELLTNSHEPFAQLSPTSITARSPTMFVFNHGLRVDHRSGVPWVDVSVIYLTQKGSVNGKKMMAGWMKETTGASISLFHEAGAIAAFYNYVTDFRQLLKDTSPHPSVPEWAAQHAERVLLPLLLPPLDILHRSLLDINAVNKMTPAKISAMKDKGNELVKAGKFGLALDVYRQAVNEAGRLLDKTEGCQDDCLSQEERGEMDKLLIKTRLNIAHCCLKLSDNCSGDVRVQLLNECVEACQKCDFEGWDDPVSEGKCLHRQGDANLRLGDPERAMMDLSKASKLLGRKDAVVAGRLAEAILRVAERGSMSSID